MTPTELRNARKRLSLTQHGLAKALGLTGAYGKDTVRSWESGRRPISGPAKVAIGLMVKLKEMVP